MSGDHSYLFWLVVSLTNFAMLQPFFPVLWARKTVMIMKRSFVAIMIMLVGNLGTANLYLTSWTALAPENARLGCPGITIGFYILPTIILLLRWLRLQHLLSLFCVTRIRLRLAKLNVFKNFKRMHPEAAWTGSLTQRFVCSVSEVTKMMNRSIRWMTCAPNSRKKCREGDSPPAYVLHDLDQTVSKTRGQRMLGAIFPRRNASFKKNDQATLANVLGVTMSTPSFMLFLLMFVSYQVLMFGMVAKVLHVLGLDPSEDPMEDFSRGPLYCNKLIQSVHLTFEYMFLFSFISLGLSPLRDVFSLKKELLVVTGVQAAAFMIASISFVFRSDAKLSGDAFMLIGLLVDHFFSGLHPVIAHNRTRFSYPWARQDGYERFLQVLDSQELWPLFKDYIYQEHCCEQGMFWEELRDTCEVFGYRVDLHRQCKISAVSEPETTCCGYCRLGPSPVNSRPCSPSPPPKAVTSARSSLEIDGSFHGYSSSRASYALSTSGPSMSAQVSFFDSEEREIAELFYYTFIAPGSSHELNLPCSLKAAMQDLLQAGLLRLDSFQEVAREVTLMMYGNTYIRFRNDWQDADSWERRRHDGE